MKNSIKVLVLLLALALILAAGCAQSEDDTETPEPGGENGNEVIGDDNEDNGNEVVGDGNGNGENEAPSDEVKQDSGTYLGQIDGHTIEIRISGVPEEKDPRAFQLSGKVQEEFESYGFETGDQVKFKYTVQEHGQVSTMTIIEIEKIQNC
ncbi:MAG TPA: hypothetical protein GX693_02035 [Firmicutes bacterium]|nr:hypothetical protein [Bacillota bacterium]